MDSLTHIALGACAGELLLGKKLGRPALLWGAIAQSFPDVDFLAATWMSPADNLLAHRGFTHSLLFTALLTPILAILAARWHRSHNISSKEWLRFFALGLMLHIFIDAFNVYGTAWFEPFSDYRVTFNTLYVADIFFSVAPGIAVLAMFFLKKKDKYRRASAVIGLTVPALYLMLGIVNKLAVDADIRRMAAVQEISYKRYFITPTPLNNFLWYVVLENDSGYNIAYRSVFDEETTIDFQFFPRNQHLLSAVKNQPDLPQLLRFSQGFYTAEYWHDTLVFNDLRFGQMIGWSDPHARFVFHYYLQHSAENKLVMQRGRFENWSWAALKALAVRIKGI
ncbi:MAG TPA: metal-dependent hydrolase [Panacibacter sp.]|nr:metal-dependent hydrolase [Panacibacter sp.]HNP43378.1 metal-dependent hydrolase [Panacibacter sp.]